MFIALDNNVISAIFIQGESRRTGSITLQLRLDMSYFRDIIHWAVGTCYYYSFFFFIEFDVQLSINQ